MTELINRLNAIYNYFGQSKQRKKLQEECAELLYCWKSLKLDEEEISEIADVFIVSAQLVLNNPEIMKVVNDKISRTEKRIKAGYYGIGKS